MPPRSKTSKSARVYRKKKHQHKRKVMVPKALTYNMWNFKRDFLHGTIDTSGVTGIHVSAYALTLADIPNYTEFTALFDQYKINFVRFSFIPFSNAVSVAEHGTVLPNSTLPVLMRYTDYDDAIIPSAVENTFMENGKVRRNLWNRTIKIGFQPKILNQVYKTALATGYAPSDKSIWIDTNDITVPHYGLKVMVTGAGLVSIPPGPMSLGKLYVSMDISFKGLK